MYTAKEKSSRVLTVLGVIAGLAGLVAYYASPEAETRPNPAEKSMMTNAAIARIAAEGQGTLREPPIQAAPRSSEALAGFDGPVGNSRPSPPDGYSFAPYHGEMPRAQIEGRIDAGGESSGTDFDWLGSTTSIEMLVTQAAMAGRDWSFGWIRLAEDATPNDLARALQGSGAEIVGSTGRLMRAKLPGDEARLQGIAALPEVDGLGTIPRERKISEVFTNQAPGALPHEQTPVFITLMTDDPAGQWRRALEDLGAVVGRFDPDIRVYTANVAYDALEMIAAADFVLAIEPIGIVEAAHDTGRSRHGRGCTATIRRAPPGFSRVLAALPSPSASWIRGSTLIIWTLPRTGRASAAPTSRGTPVGLGLAPQVVATGVKLYSAKGGGSRGEYVSFNGTSMASPSVAGVAALLMDAVPGYQEQPALTRARLMASAIRPDAWLEDTLAFPLTNTNGPGTLQAQYGLGKASARTSVLNRDQADGWISGGAVSELEAGQYAWHDIVVPEDASRLDLVMTWDEPPTDTIGSAVLNDLDLWLDRGRRFAERKHAGSMSPLPV